MEFIGKIIAVCPVKEGKSDKGEWAIQKAVAENTDQELGEVLVFEVKGKDKITDFNIQLGDKLRISYSNKGREYNGEWYPRNNAFKVEKVL